MKKGKHGKSISNWMTSALSKPPSSSNTTCTTRQSSLNKTSTSLHGKHSITSKSLSVLSVENDLNVPWSQKHSPGSASDLAVHKKKIAEVQQWLDFALSPSARHPMLLLVGPPGCGKTATVHTLAKEMGCTILEWVNPVTDVGGSEADAQPGDLIVYAESQTKQFQSFLVRANRYPCLQVGVASGCDLEKKIVIVEEFPNAFLRNPSKFHEVMKCVATSLYHPLVFIVSESHRRNSSVHTLFSKTHNSLDIHTISFNPVAHTTLVKTLLRIVESECNVVGQSKTKRMASRSRHDCITTANTATATRYHLPSREVIEQLAESSVGDIRSAINALQFTCQTGGKVVEVKGQRGVKLKRTRSGSSTGGKMKRHSSISDGSDLAAIGGRDISLFLFRALGKILYCKRETVDDEQREGEEEGKKKKDDPQCLPKHLQHHERCHLLVDPEWVIEHSQLSTDMFILYLHQNYLHMHNDVDDVVRASEYLSASDIVSTPWTDSQSTRTSLLTASSSLACRGLIHSHSPTTTQNSGGVGNKWRPLHKPQWISVNHKYRDNCRTAKRLFLHLGQSPHAHLWTPIELQTEILPHLALINMPVRNPDQAALLQSVTHFLHGYNRCCIESLGERDVESLFTQDTATTSLASVTTRLSQESGGSTIHTVSQDMGIGPVDSPDEGIEIEDFEDDLIW